jgi:hypothetical protein
MNGVLLAADKGCAKSFSAAVNAGGFEGRKTLREMTDVGCGTLIPDGSHVRLNGEESGFVSVEEAVGSPPFKAGWIEKRFLRQP